jgi:predicted transcriptional regulator
MSDIILAIRPKWTDLILSGRKTTEVRRLMPNNLDPGDTVYIYYNGQLHGHATVAGVERDIRNSITDRKLLDSACLSQAEILDYTLSARRPGCIHLADPVRYHTPKPFNGPIVQNFIYAL